MAVVKWLGLAAFGLLILIAANTSGEGGTMGKAGVAVFWVGVALAVHAYVRPKVPR